MFCFRKMGVASKCREVKFTVASKFASYLRQFTFASFEFSISNFCSRIVFAVASKFANLHSPVCEFSISNFCSRIDFAVASSRSKTRRYFTQKSEKKSSASSCRLVKQIIWNKQCSIIFAKTNSQLCVWLGGVKCGPVDHLLPDQRRPQTFLAKRKI